MARVTLQTIADHVGVSRITVSNAFSRPDQLSATLRDDSRRRRRSRLLGPGSGRRGPWLTAARRCRSAFCSSESSGHLQRRRGDDVSRRRSPTSSGRTGLGLDAADRRARRRQSCPRRDVAIDGALVYSCHPTRRPWLAHATAPPRLASSTRPPAAGIPSVNVDDRSGAFAAARSTSSTWVTVVWPRHHRLRGEYGLLPSAPSWVPRRLRIPLSSTVRGAATLLGWTGRVDPGRHSPPPVFRLPHTEPHEIGYNGARLLLDQAEPPTAVLCFSDAIAQGVIQAASRPGAARSPRTSRWSGSTTARAAARMRPALTTVRQDALAKGRAAAAALTRAIAETRAGTEATPAPPC